MPKSSKICVRFSLGIDDLPDSDVIVSLPTLSPPLNTTEPPRAPPETDLPTVSNLLTEEEHELQDSIVMNALKKRPVAIDPEDPTQMIRSLERVVVTALKRNSIMRSCISDWLPAPSASFQVRKFLQSGSEDAKKLRSLVSHCTRTEYFKPIRNLAILREDGLASPTTTFTCRDGSLCSTPCSEEDLEARKFLVGNLLPRREPPEDNDELEALFA